MLAQASDNLTVIVQSASSPYYFIGRQLIIAASSNDPDQLQIVRWEHGPNSEEVMVSEGYTITTAADGSNSRLIIASPVASDAGVYTVVAVDGQSREIRKESKEIELLCKFVSLHEASLPTTVEPLYRGQHWDPAGCPVHSGTSL